MPDAGAEAPETPVGGIDAATHARAILNILEDFSDEKARLADTQRAVLNILEDFDEEKAKVDRFNTELRAEIAERQRIEDALTAASAKFAALLEAAPDATLGIDTDGRIALVNGQVEELFGYRREELLGQTVDVLVPEQLREHHPGYRAGYVASPATRPMGSGTDLFARRKDGSEFPVAIMLSAVETDEGLLVLASARDISAQKQAEAELAEQRAKEERRNLEAQLEQARRMEAVGQLAGGVAHDFNNLLTVILAYGRDAVDTLRARLASAEDNDSLHEVLADIEEVRAAGERAAALTRQLLTFARRDAVRPEVLDLNEVLGGLASFLRRTLGEHIDLRTRSTPELWHVRADRGHVEQVLINLAVNARDAMPDGGTLTIETANATLDEAHCQDHAGMEAGPYVRLSVADTGTGMAPDVLSRAFEPFFTTKEAGRGSGLGLATVYGIVTEAGGSIRLHSEPGGGTVATVHLPVAESVVSRPAVETVVAPGGRGETVLLVEDEEPVRMVAQRILARAGYTVLVAALPSGAIALSQDHPGPIDVVLTDVVMPQMSGPDLARRIAAQRPGIRIVYASGYTGDFLASKAGVMADVPFVQKPFKREDLLEALRTTLDRPDHRRP